jgi:hypothetical protein
MWGGDETQKTIDVEGDETQKTIDFGGKLSFILSFLFLERLHCCYIYIFTAPTCTTTIITLEPCALNAELSAFHTEIYLLKCLLLCGYH